MNYSKYLVIIVAVLGAIFMGQPDGQASQEENQIHNIKPGESLFVIAKLHGVTMQDIKKANGLTGDLILAGQNLVIPTKGVSQSLDVSRGDNINFTEDDIHWLARMIHAEARGESYEGQVAVGAVILNRVNHSNFPNTVYSVLFEVTNGRHYQFSPVADGSIWLEPSTTAYEAARDAINGWDPSGGAVYFYNPKTSTSKWIFSRPVIKQIGRHVFAA
jgi:N-acetylmuramoyl-L-alanine amidase